MQSEPIPEAESESIFDRFSELEQQAQSAPADASDADNGGDPGNNA